ncbi:KRR1 interacting protein 1 [Babesia gibsoni]|uniref:KRR1 interacting protein 1 n=1 Tax=Babesia gibsoni TaxID=33632 RepID=A0AAD8LJ37_BABGI|nr:KRR1 interacting protein 1 [Babesia gibsoni]
MPRPKKKSRQGDETEAAEDGKDSHDKKVSFNDDVEKDYNEQTEDEETTTEESEDDEAVLLTGKVENKIFETLLNIKNKDPVIYDPTHKIFHDSDFENDESEEEKKSKAVTYKGMVRETLLKEGAEGFESDEDESRMRSKARTYQEEQEDLKKAFLSAAEEIDGETDFFKKSSTIDTLPETKLNRKGVASKLYGENDEGLISRYWSKSQEIDPDEEFLKDYILNQRWREDRRAKQDYLDRLRIDEEDEEHIEKADEFEYKYNYRFEEEGGTKIVGHPRNIEDSVRKADDRRKKKRQEKKEKKQEEKVRRDEELKRLKNLKRSEIEKRLKDIESHAGVAITEDAVDLNAPFEPSQHDKDMKRILGSQYHEQDDEGWNPSEAYEGEENELWWLCDHCNKGIPVGHKHFDCLECDNYSLCETCVPLAEHEHSRMTAKIVPPSCAPPAHTEEVVAKMVEDYYKLDYEDMIGDMKVRFKYRKVEPFKCDVQKILEKSDKELNAMIPLSKLLTYDEDLPKIASKKAIKRKLYEKASSNSMDRRMTKYNVNRDRLQAFGLKDKNVAKKSKKSHSAASKDQ